METLFFVTALITGLGVIGIIICICFNIHHDMSCSKTMPLDKIEKDTQTVISHFIIVGSTLIPQYRTIKGWKATYENGKTEFYENKKDVEPFTCQH